ncbi:MAG: hypothetical protein HY059_06145 [Proteobacteria bacterium]|nr:hypothetical protein [Pseudomonadota bacterium]
MNKTQQKIDAATVAAKQKAADVIDDVADLASRAAVKAGHAAHAAGTKVKDTGEKIIKATE